jgi:hypothetical protein
MGVPESTEGQSVDAQVRQLKTETSQWETVIGNKKGLIASVSGDQIEVDYPTVTGESAKFPVKKSQLSAGAEPGQN